MPHSPHYKPLIGVTARTITRKAALKERAWDAVPRSYMVCMAQEGANPIILPVSMPAAAAAAYIEPLDGLLLTGGDDIHPRFFGQQPHPSILVDDERDAFELEVTRLAWQRNLPILAICRGIQVLNVALGGELHQDVPSQVQGAVDHEQKGDGDGTWHTVEVEPGSRLAEILGTERLEVNSFHHQACRDLPPELVATARTQDGVIEALEDPSRAFCLGVQWHAEVTAQVGDAPSKALFQAFVAAVRKGSGAASKLPRPAPSA